jgi:hypothetical protein
MSPSPTLESRRLAGVRRHLSRGAWFFPSLCQSLSRFGCGLNHRSQFPFGLFGRAMLAMVQRLDAHSFFFHTQLSVSTFLALVLKVFRNRFRCHSQSVAELSPSKLSNFGHSVQIDVCMRGDANCAHDFVAKAKVSSNNLGFPSWKLGVILIFEILQPLGVRTCSCS